VPFVEPFAETIGAGMSDQNPVNVMGYRYPMITVNADTPDAEVHAMMKAIADTFDMFKNANPIMPRWAMNLAGTPPMDAPFHNGAISYLREAGLWTPQSQQWQDRTLRRLQVLRAAWVEFLPGARARNLSEADFATAWSERRTATIATLN
jgi:hypothetical protein